MKPRQLSEQSATQLLSLLKEKGKPSAARLSKLRKLRIHLIQSAWRRVVARKTGKETNDRQPF